MNRDLFIYNANVITMDPLLPRARSLVVSNGRVLAVGTDEEMHGLATPSALRINANGMTVLPGLQDTHLHLQDSGYYNATMADLTCAKTLDDLKNILRAHARKHPDGWVFGVGWYSGIFSEDNLHGTALDDAASGRPCLIYASDFHSACLNSAACQAVGLVEGVSPPLNGRFVTYADGRPTGMVHEDAVTWVRERMPPLTDSDYSRGVLFGQQHANQNGLTGVIDASVGERHCRVYRKMASEGALTVRVAGCAKVDPGDVPSAEVARLKELRRDSRFGLFTVHSAKFFLDGVFENRTAAMIGGYADEAGGNAPLMFSPEAIRHLFAAFDAERFQIHVHVIGDLAARTALDGLEHALHVNGPWPGRHQLTHLQCVRREDIPRIGGLGCIANIQTLWARHAPSVVDVAVPMVGRHLSDLIYPFRSIIDAGALWTLSSDWAVSTLNPFQIMETAITRQPPGKRDHPVFLPGQRLTRHEALMGYTTNAAVAAWRPDTGRLSPGSAGDVIVVDRDILDCNVYELGQTQVLATFVAGRQVYMSDSIDF